MTIVKSPSEKKRILFCNETCLLATGYANYGYEILTRLYDSGKYELAEYATYSDGTDSRLINFPWKHMPAVPPPSQPSLLEKYNSHMRYQWGALLFDDACLHFQPDVVCLIPSSKILTARGYQFITDVTCKDYVFTHNFRLCKVKEIMYRHHQGQIYKIYFEDGTITLTGNHPILIKFGSSNIFRLAYQIQVGDKLVFSCPHTKTNINKTVYRIEVLEYDGMVHNLEVEADHTYIANGITVHNCDIRDPWMFWHEEHALSRPYYNWFPMTTIDSMPQNPDWIHIFQNADKLLGYTDWGLENLNIQANNTVNIGDSPCPSADENIFYPMDKNKTRVSANLDPDIYIVGTVMRNQPRKLYPDLFLSFRKFLDEAPPFIRDRTYLYIHTAWPDSGWDIPQLLFEYGISHRVLLTYFCPKCVEVSPGFFQGHTTHCKNCGELTSTLPHVQLNMPKNILAQIYNLFDVYVQYANCEGFGMPQIEAAACGIPLMSVDYSAMKYLIKELEGIPIPIKTMARDHGVNADRALPDNQAFVKLLVNFLQNPTSIRRSIGDRIYQNFKKKFTYDEAAKKWMNHFDNLPDERIGLWSKPFEFNQKIQEIDFNLPDYIFLEECLSKIALRPDLTRSSVYATILTYLADRESDPKRIRHPIFDGIGNVSLPFSKEFIYQFCLELRKAKLTFEKRRLKK